MSQSFDFNHPPVGFRFRAFVEGDQAEASFQEASGLTVEIPTEALVEGGENGFTYLLPKPFKYSNLVLKRGFMYNNSNLLAWCTDTFKNGLNKKIDKKKLIVQLLNDKVEIIKQWKLEDAYPVKWSMSNFNAMESKLAIETLEFAYRQFIIE